MKSQDFASVLLSFSHVADAHDADASAAGWASLARAFSIKPNMKPADLCALIAQSSVARTPDPTIETLLESLPSLRDVLRPFSKKGGPIESLDALQAALSAVKDRSLSDVLEGVAQSLTAQAKKSPSKPKKVLDQDSIDLHLAALEESIRDERAFKLAFASMKDDRKLKLPELKVLANRFTNETATSKAQALKLIWARHASLMESRAKDAAIGGRTAA